MEKFVDLFLDYLSVERGLADNTIISYRRDLSAYLGFLENLHQKSILVTNREDIREFMFYQKDKGMTASTIARRLAALRMFYRFLSRERFIKADVSTYIDTPRLWKRIPTILSSQEIVRLIESPDLKSPRGIRDRAILELMYATGMRISEVSNLKMRDVNLEVGFVRCFGKGNKERIIPVGKKAAIAIERYLAQSRPIFLKTRNSLELFFE